MSLSSMLILLIVVGAVVYQFDVCGFDVGVDVGVDNVVLVVVYAYFCWWCPCCDC